MELNCGATLATCRCALGRERCDGRHLCQCGGSWKGDANRREDILILPISWGLNWAETISQSEDMIETYARALESR